MLDDIIKKEEREHQHNIVTTRLVATIAVLTALSGTLISTTAWADTIQCTGGPCIGTPDNDTIFGSQGPILDDQIFALAGDDLIYGRTGNDEISGDEGRDTIYGGEGDDRPQGGAGIDTIYGGTGNDLMGGGEDNDRVYGEAGDDGLDGNNGNDKLFGGDGNDSLRGSSGADQFRCGSGVDTIEDYNPTEGDKKSSDCENF
jgi:Ca2+-binding RTX toxin-like protein